MLLEKNIPFDIALVNYKTRKESDKEATHAQTLAKKYHKKCFLKICLLEKKNFEYRARECRYRFFEEVIKEEKYDTLILAHQLNDKFEWFLMQLSKGAGVKELLSMQKYEKREHYRLSRPLINTSREEIVEYLHTHDHPYFVDQSNESETYTRNRFRKKFSNTFLHEYAEGVKRSFEYLEKDKSLLFERNWIKEDKLYRFEKCTPDLAILKIDTITKELGYLLSKAQRDEIIKQHFSCVISDTVAIDHNDTHIFISPYHTPVMDKKFKEKCRIEKIPPKIRGYVCVKEIEATI